MGNNEFSSQIPDLEVTNLNFLGSDHQPVKLVLSAVRPVTLDRRNRSFIF